MNKITLDMDFGDEAEDTVEEIEIPKAEKTKDEKKDYIKGLIEEGLDMCESISKRLADVTEDVAKFSGCGINDNMIEVLYYLESIFNNNIPELLKGNYDNLIPDELDELGLSAESEGLKDILKISRKKLVKMIEKESNK